MVELLGTIASMFIVASFLFKNDTTIRIINTFGGALFLIYGCLISSMSTVILQTILIFIQVFKIIKIRKEN